ncbi:MAG: PadR family transcriptional regulator [Haloarculaceae archaeon]
MDDLTGLQRDMLYVIAARGQPHYRDIKRGLNDYYEKAIYNGIDREYTTRRVFPHLDTLIEKGLVEGVENETHMDYYRVTEDGWETIDRRRAWERQCIEGRADAPAPE